MYLLFYGLHDSGTVFCPYFGLHFLWSFVKDFMFGIPVENMHSDLTALVFQEDDLIVGGALPKINQSHIWFFDSGQFNLLFKNKHDQLCKFRLWFYFLFS